MVSLVVVIAIVCFDERRKKKYKNGLCHNLEKRVQINLGENSRKFQKVPVSKKKLNFAERQAI